MKPIVKLRSYEISVGGLEINKWSRLHISTICNFNIFRFNRIVYNLIIPCGTTLQYFPPLAYWSKNRPLNFSSHSGSHLRLQILNEWLK